jgi:GAF domain-containing protein
MPEPHDILALCGLLERGAITGPQFFERFTRALAAQIGCSRAGVWRFVDTDAVEGRLLRCIAMYDTTLNQMVQVADIVHAEDGPYFEALLSNDCVVAANARTDPATVGFLDSYLLPLNIHSLLDVCFSINGVPFGIFSCEQAGAPVAWTQRQLQLLRQIGSRASLTLMRAATATVDTAPGALWDGSGGDRYLGKPISGDTGEDN